MKNKQCGMDHNDAWHRQQKSAFPWDSFRINIKHLGPRGAVKNWVDKTLIVNTKFGSQSFTLINHAIDAIGQKILK